VQRCAAFTKVADIFVVAYGLLGKESKGLMFIRKAIDPGFHIAEHFTLDLGVRVVEIWVEAEEMNRR
jgi:hypothetical protein